MNRQLFFFMTVHFLRLYKHMSSMVPLICAQYQMYLFKKQVYKFIRIFVLFLYNTIFGNIFLICKHEINMFFEEHKVFIR